MRYRGVSIAATITALLVSLSATAGGGQTAEGAERRFTPGGAGAGDPYFPLDGNGGYDVKHYDVDVSYNPVTEHLSGTATIAAQATQNLSRFNFDFDGLRVQSIHVAGQPATWTRHDGELVVTPSHGIASGHGFTSVVTYQGTPRQFRDPGVGTVGFVRTNDGAVVVGEPHVASIWFPANDHPTDKASFSFHITVPAGLQAVSNGRLASHPTRAGWTTWNWMATEPMATYLATTAIGHFDIRHYRANGLGFWDAVDPQLDDPGDNPAPRTGSRYAWSDEVLQQAPSFKRLAHRIEVPAEGTKLSFWVDRDTERKFDFLTVEAHPVGTNEWTTLPDENGHTNRSLGFACPFDLVLHPFLKHYVTDNGDGSCSPSGTTGVWRAISGRSHGFERWTVDLSRYAGATIQLSISYVSDEGFQARGVFVDDVVGPNGQGTTSFETDGNTMDGWTVPGPPPGDAPNPNDWKSATRADVTTPADYVKATLARQPEILRFESATFGAYPWSTSGAIVDVAPIGFALENQTRPTYSSGFFDFGTNEDVVVHELAHQWYGDSVAVRRWSEVWLNEGFATYAQWLWSDHEGFDTPADIFNFWMTEVPADDDLWRLEIGDPGPRHLFDFPVYVRGALTLQALRMKIGDQAFFTVLRRWAAQNAGGNGDTAGFRTLAERVSGKPLGALFHTWLHTTTKPSLGPAAARAAKHAAPHGVPIAVKWLLAQTPK
jgi:Peptidase family M1 domain/Peptidase M1 N-terminal domain/Immune inhibitor A-like, MAM domain